MKQIYLLLLFSIGSLSTASHLLAQDIVYDAVFNGNGSLSGRAEGTIGGNWTAIGQNGCTNDGEEFFGTRNGSFEITNFDGSGCGSDGQEGGANNSEWRSSLINIRNYVNISVNIEVSGIAGGNGFDSNPINCSGAQGSCIDKLTAMVTVDGETYFSRSFSLSGSSVNFTFDEPQGICGNQMLIRIRGGTQSSEESIFIDRVLVTGNRGRRPAAPKPPDYCEGEDGVLQILNVSPNAEIVWIAPNGDDITPPGDKKNLQLKNLRIEDTGLYTAFVIDPDQGCTTPILLDYDLFVFPTFPQRVQLDIPNTPICEGEDVKLKASPTDGNYEYTWIGPDNQEIVAYRNSDTCLIENVTVGNAGAYLVLVSNPDFGACGVGEAENDLLINQGPGQVTINVSNYCVGSSATIDVTTQNPGNYIYTWILPDGTRFETTRTQGTLTINNIQFRDEGRYRLLVSNADGSCERMIGNGINVVVDNGIDKPNITIVDDVCIGFPSLQTDAQGNGTIYWYDEDDNLVAQDEETYTPDRPGKYYARVIDPNGGCQSPPSDPFTVVEIEVVEAKVQASEGRICSNAQTTLVASGGIQFLWSTGETSSSIVVGAGTYDVTVSNAMGCEDQASFTIERFPEFDATITGTSPICAGTTTDLSVSIGSNFQWSNGATSNSINVGTGSYEVTVTDENGCQEISQFELASFDDFEAVITGESQICEGQQSTLIASLGENYIWSNGATSQSIDVNGGEYSVTVIDANGCQAEANFIVEQLPDFQVTISGESQICEGAQTILTATDGASYLWSTGATSRSIEISEGNYSVTVNNVAGCEDQASFVIESFPEFEAEIIGTSPICAGTTTDLRIEEGASFQWSNNSESNSINVGAGSYEVTVTDENGCQEISQFELVYFDDFEAKITGENQICKDQQSTLIASLGETYLWSTGATNQSINVSAGEYSVTIVDVNNCQAEANFNVEQLPDFQATINGNTQICDGELSRLTASEGINYLWNTGETSKNIEVGEGNYSVTVTNANGCEASSEVEVVSSIKPSFSISDAASCSSSLDSYQITIKTLSANTFNITNGEILQSDSGNYVLELPAGQNFQFTITNNTGCSISEMITAPDCSCPSIAPPTSEGDMEICEGEVFPILSMIATEEDVIINWYDAANGGNLIQSNSANFQPENAGTYYAEVVKEVSSCRSPRTPVSLTVNERPALSLLETSNINCNDAFGTIQVSGTGDNAPFEYALNNGTFSANNNFTNLAEGNYQVSIRNAKACVSQFDAEIKVEQRFDEQSFTKYSCKEDELGTETIRLTNSLGCDSIITIITLDGSSEPTNLSATTCDPNQVATETLTLTNQYGCDSLVITSYTLIPSDMTYVNVVSCNPDDVGESVLPLENQFGCDSIVIIQISYAEENRIYLESISCNPDDVGIDTSYYTNQFGCDSIVVMETKLQGTGHSELTFFRKMTCDFGRLGLDTTHYQNQYGCDSIVIIERYFGFPPPPQLNITRDQRICRGDTVFLTSDSYDYNLQWLKDGEEITGATSNSLYLTEGGGYAISHFNDEGCVVVSDVVEIMIKDTPSDPVFSNTNNFLQLETEIDTQMVRYQWYLDGEVLEDATSDNHCAKTSGVYTVIATNEMTGCTSSFSANIEHDPDIEACLVSAAEVYEQVSLKIYPNPHMEEFHITYDLERAAKVEVKIFDLVGKVHYRRTEKTAHAKFNHAIVTKSWAKGVYLLQINVDGVNYIHKIVKGK